MNLPVALFSAPWHAFACLVALLCLGWAGWRVDWRHATQSIHLHLTLGFAVGLMFMWSLKAGVLPGLNLHLLGAMAATLTLGPALSLVALGLALAGITLNGAIDWASWPINYLFMVAIPVALASVLKGLAERILPAHFFIFVFVVAFIGSGVTVFLQGAVVSIGLALSGAYPTTLLFSDYLPYFMLLGFAEAWLSGAVVTLLVVYKPGWVKGFDERRYLFDK